MLILIDSYGDRDGDGFQEYQTRSPVGYENMGWKDLETVWSIRTDRWYMDPKALCELQGYVYDAWLRMSEIFDELGKDNAPTNCGGRRRFCSSDLMKSSGMMNSALRLGARRRKEASLNCCLQRGALPLVRHCAGGQG